MLELDIGALWRREDLEAFEFTDGLAGWPSRGRHGHGREGENKGEQVRGTHGCWSALILSNLSRGCFKIQMEAAPSLIKYATSSPANIQLQMPIEQSYSTCNIRNPDLHPFHRLHHRR